MIRFHCPACDKAYRIDDKFAGRATTCKQCGGAIQVPAISAVENPPQPAKPAPPPAPAPAPPPAAPARRRPPPPRIAPPPSASQGSGAALGLGIGALVLGIIGLLSSWIPFIGCISLPFSGIGLLLAVVGLIIALTSGGKGIGFPIAGGATCLLALGVFTVVTYVVAGAANNVANTMANSIQDSVIRAHAEELEAAREELNELQARQEGALAARPAIQQFEVVKAEFAFLETNIGTHPLITLEVRNGLDQDVSAFVFQATITTTDIPKLNEVDTLRFDIASPLRAGETREWDIRPGNLSPIVMLPRDRDDYEVQVVMLQVEDLSDRPIFPEPLSDEEQARLDELPAVIAELARELAKLEARRDEALADPSP